MLPVKFCEHVEDTLLKYAVIIAKTEGKWVFCKHKDRNTYEIPGGHREEGEDILTTAKRELAEETGALEFDIKPVCVYCVNDFGMLYFADIKTFGPIDSEIEKIIITDDLVTDWTYPLIHPKLIAEAQRRGVVE